MPACVNVCVSVQAPMLDLLHRHIDGKGKQAKLKSPNELQVQLRSCLSLCMLEPGSHADSDWVVRLIDSNCAINQMHLEV